MQSQFLGVSCHPEMPADRSQVWTCVPCPPPYESFQVKHRLHPMDMFRHEVATVIERWVHESDLDFIEMMHVMEELKMELVFQNLDPDNEDDDGIHD